MDSIRKGQDQERTNLPGSSLRSIAEQVLYLAIFFVFLLVSVWVDREGSGGVSGPNVSLQSGWTVEATGEESDLAHLPTGSVTVSRNIAGRYENGQALCLKSLDTNFDLYADGTLFYSYRPEIPKRLGQSYGMYIHTAMLPAGTKVLTMALDPLFSESQAGLDRVRISFPQQYMSEFFRDNIIGFLRSSINLLIGLLFLAVGIASRMMMKSAGLDFISFGILSLMIGLSGFNDTLLLQIVSGHPALIRVITYVCLMFIPFPMVSFFAGAIGRSRSRIVSAFLAACLLNFALQVGLTYYGLSDYYRLVYISHGMIILSFGISVWMIVQAEKEKTIRRDLLHYLLIGIAVSALCVLIDVIRYYFTESYGSAVWTRTGVFIFMFLIGLYLFREQTRTLKEKQKENQKYIRELSEAFAKAIDIKDNYTNGHSTRVAIYTSMLARELGYDRETVEKYYRIALLHDIGKIGIPRSLLQKPGKLTDDEYELIKSHAEKGYEVLKDISAMPELAVGARYHHERPDGKGYPAGLRQEEIPRVAQIIAVADCFDAMYSDRPYRKCMPFEKAVGIIREVSGTQLTPDVVDAFMRLVEKKELRPREEEKNPSRTV